jgi:hypothetical protein
VKCEAYFIGVAGVWFIPTPRFCVSSGKPERGFTADPTADLNSDGIVNSIDFSLMNGNWGLFSPQYTFNSSSFHAFLYCIRLELDFHVKICYNEAMQGYQAIQKYFWDVDPVSLDREKDNIFIISRILEYGDLAAVRWLLRAYPLSLIKQALTTKKYFSRASAQFWQQYLELQNQNIPCLQKSSQKMPVRLWPH